VVYSHGGTRRGANFTSNREDDLRELLAERLGKNRTTINTYLNQSEYINETAFNALIEADVGRIFFDKCRVIKRDLIKNLKSDGLDDTEVMATVSDKILEWLAEFLRTGNVNSVQEDPDPGEPDETPENDSHGTPIEASEDEIFQHQTRANMHDSPEPPAEEDVQNEIRTVVSALTAYEEQTPMQTDVGLQVIDEQILKLSRIRQMLLDIMNGSESSAEEEAV
jgi:hypothetical protein